MTGDPKAEDSKKPENASGSQSEKPFRRDPNRMTTEEADRSGQRVVHDAMPPELQRKIAEEKRNKE